MGATHHLTNGLVVQLAGFAPIQQQIPALAALVNNPPKPPAGRRKGCKRCPDTKAVVDKDLQYKAGPLINGLAEEQKQLILTLLKAETLTGHLFDGQKYRVFTLARRPKKALIIG